MKMITSYPAKLTCITIAFYLMLTGCAPILSQSTLNVIDLTITFPKILDHPDSYTGKRVVCGGRILELKARNEEIWLEVLQQPLDTRYRPENSDFSQGRFFIILKGDADPSIYPRDRRVTVVGEVTGSMVSPIKDMPYKYPVITPQELILIDAYPFYDRTNRLYYSAAKK